MLKTIIKKLDTPNWLSIVLLIVLTLRIPTLFMPYSYGDEMIYLTLGEGIRQGIPLYGGLYDNKPPLLYLTAAIAGNLFFFKAILMLWNIITIFVFWKLTEALFPKNQKLQKVSTVALAILTTLPLLEGNVVNAEILMILPTISAFLLLLSKKNSPKNLFTAGVLFSLAALFKLPAAFEVPAIVAFWLITNLNLKKTDLPKLKSIALNTFYLIAGFLTPIALTLVYFYLKGLFKDYFEAAFLQNIGYLSSWRPGSVSQPFIQKNTPLLIRAAVVIIGVVILFVKRKILSKQFIFVSLWLLFALFGVTLSERPYPHYLIQAVPAISILIGYLIAAKTLLQAYATVPLALAIFIPVYFNFWHYPTLPFYQRYVNLILGETPKEEYLADFGQEVPRNYKIADFIVGTTSPNDRIFVWGDDAKIYALTRRLPPIKYLADYHIKDHWSNQELLETIMVTKPKKIILLPEVKTFPQFEYFLEGNYVLTNIIDGAEIWSLLIQNPK